MQRNSGARLLPLFITFIVIVIIIVAIISLARAFFGGSGGETDAPTDVGRETLLNTSGNHSVRMTTRGPIVADEAFRSVAIEVSPSERTMNVYTGYLDEVTETSSHANNQQAYEQFVYALDKAEMMDGTEPDDETVKDIRGICATGYVYEYTVLVNANPVKNLWTSTCDGSRGTLAADIGQLNDLFTAQIPNADELSPFRSNPLRLRF